MTDRQWRSYLGAARKYSAECELALTRLGKEAFEALQNKVRSLFAGHEQMTPMEWVIAAGRYQDAQVDRSFGNRDLDTLMRWAFVLLWWRDKLTEQYQQCLLSSAEVDEADPRIGDVSDGVERIDEMHESCIALRSMFQQCRDAVVRLCPEALRKRVRAEFKEPTKAVEELAAQVAAERTLWDDIYTRVVSVLGAKDEVDPQQVTLVQKSLKDVESQIAVIEDELQLKVQHEKDSPATYLQGVLDKVDRYVAEHPQEYMWYCAKCGWEGQLLKKRRADGALINTLDKWWVWKCPGCGAIIAYDKEHPLFDGKILFSHRLWELVCDGKVSLVDAGYILETAPEYLVWAARTVYKKRVPLVVLNQLQQHDALGAAELADDVASDEEDGG